MRGVANLERTDRILVLHAVDEGSNAGRETRAEIRKLGEQ
jgi:hypothetical protein